MRRLASALLGLFVALLEPGAGFAQDACLTGASTLGDQRGMETLRGETESACPCVSAESRASYRRCAKSVLADLITEGTLREQCETAARRNLKGAACGTASDPCGRVTQGAQVPVTCRVKRAEACTDRAGRDQTACPALDFCADVIDWTAATCSDVRERGPFEAGVRVITMTKSSVVTPGQPRVLQTVVWYPTAAGAGPIDPSYGGVLDAAVDASAGPYPVLMFSHGSCGYPAQSKFLLPLIAARGYVVVAPPHPGNTLFDGLANCGTQTALVLSALERPADVIFALDQLLAENAAPASDFFGVLDPARVGMMGHSFGGFTTYRVVAQDARFRVAVPLAPAAQGAPPMTMPSLSIIATLDSYVDNDLVRVAYDASAAPKYLVEIANTGHFAFSDGCFPSPDCDPPTTLTQDEAHLAVLRWVVPFIERHLGGDESFAPFFDLPRPAGVTYEATP
jgi:predicted dienelactone hydrolase